MYKVGLTENDGEKVGLLVEINKWNGVEVN
jgi:hypothetical protein